MRRLILDLFAVPDGWSHAHTVLEAGDIGLEPRTGLRAWRLNSIWKK
ncbi:hypothetical protein ACH4E5_06385 [Streptomyces afghaniensis]